MLKYQVYSSMDNGFLAQKKRAANCALIVCERQMNCWHNKNDMYLFWKEVCEEVIKWGNLEPIRIVEIEYKIDELLTNETEQSIREFINNKRNKQ